MSITKDEWKIRLKRWSPSWFNETEDGINDAVLESIAKILETSVGQIDQFIDETYLENQTGSYLDLSGKERGVYRLSGESDNSFRERIRYIINTTNSNSLVNAINGVLNVTPAVVIENWKYGFANDELFCDVDVSLSKTKNYNRFTVLIPDQNLVDDSLLKNSILKVIDDNKALGVLYDLAYAVTLTLFSEEGDTLIFEDGDVVIGEVS
jgi:hypothetical protein